MYDLAGLYWRVKGNFNQAVECIRRSLVFVPDEWLDVPLLNLANVLYTWGHLEQATDVTNSAIQANEAEVS